MPANWQLDDDSRRFQEEVDALVRRWARGVKAGRKRTELRRLKTHPPEPLSWAPVENWSSQSRRTESDPRCEAPSVAEASPEGEPERRSAARSGAGGSSIDRRRGKWARRSRCAALGAVARPIGQAISARSPCGRAPRSLSRRR